MMTVLAADEQNRPRSETPDPSDLLLDVSAAQSQVLSPKLAVVVNCYNYEQYVGAAIDSVLSQGRPDCELVVVDDGSTDGSWRIITERRVTAWRIRNSGQVGACVFGLDRTTAPFVLFLDADDTLKPGSLAKIIDRLDPDVAKLQFPLTRIDGSGAVLGPAIPALDTFREQDRLMNRVMLTGTYVTPPTSGNVFRRDVCNLLHEVTYDAAVDGVILFASPFFGDVVSVAEELGNYRVHGANKSGQGRVLEGASFEKVLDRFDKRMTHLREIVSRLGSGHQIPPAHTLYYYLERRLCADIASGNKPKLRGVWQLLGALRHETWPLKSKAAMATFFLLATVLPVSRTYKIMAYRFKFGDRSVRGFFNAMMTKT